MPTSDEERKSIIQKILLSSPPGQFDLILADLNNILQSSSPSSAENVLSTDFIESVRNEYNKKTSRCLILDKEEKEKDNNDNNNNNEEEDKFANALKRAMGSYMTKNFSSSNNNTPTSTVSSTYKISTTTPASEYKIVTYAERINLKNYHAASWNTTWTVNLNSTNKSTEAIVQGLVSIHSHTFEDGNVQLHSTHKLGPASASSSTSDPMTLAMGVVSHISHWEREDVMGKLGGMYDGMSSGMLKSLRRVMPITRTRMEWNVETHRMVRTLMMDQKEG